MEPSNYLPIRARKHVDDFSFGAAAPIVPDALCGDAIAVQDLAHFAWPNEQIVAAVIRHEESESVGMSLHRATDEVELRCDAELAFAVAHHETIVLESGELRFELAHGVVGDAESARELR